MKKMFIRSLALLTTVFVTAAPGTVSARADDSEGAASGEMLPDTETAVALSEDDYSDISATQQWYINNEASEKDVGEHPVTYLKLYRTHVATDEEPVPVEDAGIKEVNTPEGEWVTTVTWTRMPDIDEDGRAFLYSVKEVDQNGNDYSPLGYVKSEAGMNVYNVKQILPETDADGSHAAADAAPAATPTPAPQNVQNAQNAAESEQNPSSAQTTETAQASAETQATAQTSDGGSKSDDSDGTTATGESASTAQTLPLTSAKTGDENHPGVWLILLIAAAAAAIAVLVVKKNSGKNNK